MKAFKFILILVASLTLLGSAFGCDSKKDRDNNGTYSPVIYGPPPMSEPGRITRVVIQTPARTTYIGEGTQMYRKYTGYRGTSWAGLSPNEVVAKMQPMQITQGPQAAFNVSPEGVAKGAEKKGDLFTTGGFKGYGILETLWTHIKDWFWLGAIIIGVLVVVYFLVPAAKPIIGGFFRAIASIIPFIGSFVENIVAKFKLGKPLSQVVTGVDAVKAKIEALPDYVDPTTGVTETGVIKINKADLVQLINDTLQIQQDVTTQTTVSEYRTK